MKLYILIPTLACLLLVSSCKHNETIKPQRKDIVEAVYASGEIVPKNQYIVNSMVDGYLKTNFVSEGTVVRKGSILFQIESIQSEAMFRNATDNLTIATKNYSDNSAIIGQLEAQLETASAKCRNDSVNYVRYERLAATGAVSSLEREQAKLVWQTSQNQVKSIQDNIRSTRNDLFRQFSNAKSTYESSLESRNNYLLTSGINGKVYNVVKVPGDLVKRGDMIAILGNADTMIINLNIQDEDIARISIGQQVLVELNTAPDRTFKAQVTKIFPAFNAQDQSFKIEAQFTETVPHLFAGTQVIANIIVSTRKMALVVPKTYINSNSEVILKKSRQTVKVKLGIENTEWVEVLDGLKESDELIKQKTK